METQSISFGYNRNQVQSGIVHIGVGNSTAHTKSFIPTNC